MTDTERERIKAICEVANIKDIGELSDGFHTFNGLYEQRMILFAALVKAYKNRSWKSYRHEDGEYCFGGGWFIVGIDTPEGSYTYHYENKYWDMFDCIDLPRAPHWDGHTEADAETRLMSLPTVQLGTNLAEVGTDVPGIYVGELISRQAAMERLMAQNVIMDGSEYHNGFNAGVNRAQEVIRNLPPVQPTITHEQAVDYLHETGWLQNHDRILTESRIVPKHGEWIERESGTEDKENGFETVIVCSCCDFPATTFYSEDCESRTQIRTDFCPNCGADMRGEANGQN